ncbi:hypothetical protein ACTFJW_02605 [Clostridium cagae]|nr:hypothetical protein [uncultured Clostridium sp.]
MKAKKLVKELNKLIEKYGENIDVQTFSCQLGIYKECDEVSRINIKD